MKLERIINLILSILLGGMLVYGGLGKFSKPIPTPNQVIAKAQKILQPEKAQTLQKVLYINGMKQTGYMWQFLGAMQILCGVLLISQVFTLLGAIMAFPIVVNIFFFHLFLEFEETGELLQTLSLLLINTWFLIVAIRKMKEVLFQREQLQFLNK